jgi:hypothetical protein
MGKSEQLHHYKRVAYYTTQPLAINFVNHKIKQLVIQQQIALQEFG